VGEGRNEGVDGVISWDGMYDYMDPCWWSYGEEWSDQFPLLRRMNSRAPDTVSGKEVKQGTGARTESKLLKRRG